MTKVPNKPEYSHQPVLRVRHVGSEEVTFSRKNLGFSHFPKGFEQAIGPPGSERSLPKREKVTKALKKPEYSHQRVLWLRHVGSEEVTNSCKRAGFSHVPEGFEQAIGPPGSERSLPKREIVTKALKLDGFSY